MVSIGGVLQKPVTDYTVSGTTLTTTDTIASGIVIDTYVIHNAGGTTPIIEDNSVTTAKILDNNVTGAKIAMGSDAAGDILYYNGTDYVRLGKGTTGHYLSQGGSNAPAWAAVSAGFTLGTKQTTTSGTAATFGSIPSGTKMIVINLENVSLNAAVQLNVTIGDAGGLETSGYSSSGKQIAGTAATQTIGSTAAFVSYGCTSGAEYIMSMQWILTCLDTGGLTWICSHQGFATNGTTVNQFGLGDKTLSAELTQVSVGGGTFDAGAINIMYM